MTFGKTIRIFLIDGDPNGRMTCELSNWTGKAYKIPRIKIKDCGDRTDLANTGIYLLMGKDEDGNDQVYIGEAENVIKRLSQHLTQKDFWHEAIIFISKDDNLNKAHVKYLENRLYEIAREAKRYVLSNTSTPTLSSISEADSAEVEEFIEHVRMLVNTLGHKVFDEKRGTVKGVKANEFTLRATRDANANRTPSSEGFVVFKGSKAATDTTNSVPLSIVKMRETLATNGVLVHEGEVLVFKEDYVFSSPSMAAAVVLGSSANGMQEWKLKDGTTLKEFESREQ